MPVHYEQPLMYANARSEAYLPNRFWKKQEDGEKWIYIFAGQHEKDIEFIERLSKPKVEQCQSIGAPVAQP